MELNNSWWKLVKLGHQSYTQIILFEAPVSAALNTSVIKKASCTFMYFHKQSLAIFSCLRSVLRTAIPLYMQMHSLCCWLSFTPAFLNWPTKQASHTTNVRAKVCFPIHRPTYTSQIKETFRPDREDGLTFSSTYHYILKSESILITTTNNAYLNLANTDSHAYFFSPILTRW